MEVPDLPQNIQAQLEARIVTGPDHFGGWEPEDVDFLSTYKAKLSDQEVVEGVIVDWLGSRTLSSNYPNVPGAAQGLVNSALPIPTDGVHANTIEYVALSTAVDLASSSGSNRFSVLEVGASYAPWATLAALVAKRAGFDYVNCLAVEASESAMQKINRHIELNELDSLGGICFESVNAAISASDSVVYFPSVDTAEDNGGRVELEPVKKDYRGFEKEYVEVEGRSLASLLARWDLCDFLHADLQGFEAELLRNDAFIATICEKVRVFFLATQTRLIEGIALEVMSRNGWVLHRERPTMFKQNRVTDDPAGWTLADGGQIWLNSRYLSA